MISWTNSRTPTFLLLTTSEQGRIPTSDHQSRYLTDLMNDRWSRDLPTVFTTNMPITAQRDSRGLSDLFVSQSWDRITDSFVLISLEGESHRGTD